MKFTKVQGCGNNYIVVNEFEEELTLSKEQIAKICSVNYGVGSDGILTITPSDVAEFKMRIINIDGTEAEMCGNGLRCVSRLAFDMNIVNKDKFKVETGAGIKDVEILFSNINGKKEVGDIKINMGKAKFLENPTNNEYNLYCVSMGNPHALMLVDNFTDEMVENLGKKIENHVGFINRTNVEFVKIIDKNNIEVRTWERGCGETFACGSGACASVAGLNKEGLIDKYCNVKMLGGNLKIEIIDEEIFMIGEGLKVFEGEIDL